MFSQRVLELLEINYYYYYSQKDENAIVYGGLTGVMRTNDSIACSKKAILEKNSTRPYIEINHFYLLKA